MSACISTHGEYSAHEPDDEFVCRLCGELDERALRAELARLRSTLPSVEDVARQQVADLRRSFSRAVERTAKRIERMGRTVSTELAAGLVREMVQPAARIEGGGDRG